MVVEALPCLLSFITTFIWVFFTTAPSSSVTATWLWLTAIAIPTIFSGIYLIDHSCNRSSIQRLSWYTVSSLQRAALDVIRSITSAAAIALITMDVDWIILRSIGSDLEPLGSSEEIKGEIVAGWVGAILAGILILVITVFIFTLVGPVLGTDFTVLQTALQDAKNERGNLKTRERLRQEEAGMVECEQEERK